MSLPLLLGLLLIQLKARSQQLHCHDRCPIHVSQSIPEYASKRTATTAVATATLIQPLSVFHASHSQASERPPQKTRPKVEPTGLYSKFRLLVALTVRTANNTNHPIEANIFPRIAFIKEDVAGYLDQREVTELPRLKTKPDITAAGRLRAYEV